MSVFLDVVGCQVLRSFPCDKKLGSVGSCLIHVHIL